MKVWVVSEYGFDFHIIKYICGSYKTAIKRWEELRDEMIKENQDMVVFCQTEGYSDAAIWEKYVALLQNLKPGELCDCDCPEIKEWEIEP